MRPNLERAIFKCSFTNNFYWSLLPVKLGANCKFISFNLSLISVKDFVPKLRILIISSSDLLINSPIVLIPSLFKLLNALTPKSNSSIGLSNVASFSSTCFSSTKSISCVLSSKSTITVK